MRPFARRKAVTSLVLAASAILAAACQSAPPAPLASTAALPTMCGVSQDLHLADVITIALADNPCMRTGEIILPKGQIVLLPAMVSVHQPTKPLQPTFSMEVP